MSLIDEALKRAQAAGQGGPAGKERPWAPMPMPDAGLARRRTLLRWLMVASLAVVAAGGLAFWFRNSPPRALPLKAAGGPGEGRPAATVPVPTAVAIAAAVAPPTALAPKPRSTRRPPTEAEAAEAAEGLQMPPVEVAPAPHAAQRLVDAKIYAGVVTLPGGAKIELGGIVWSETEPRALINDRVAAAGSYVEGFSVVRIEQDRVVLEKDGVTIFLTVK